MSSFEVICLDCGGPMEMRKFKDGEDPDGSNIDINIDWWCPACKLRWLAMDGKPMEAEDP